MIQFPHDREKSIFDVGLKAKKEKWKRTKRKQITEYLCVQ